MQIPPFDTEIENLFRSLEQSSHKSIMISSANSGEGVSCTAQALAHRMLLSGKSALLVDLNVLKPAMRCLIEATAQPNEKSHPSLSMPAMITNTSNDLILQGVCINSDKALVNLLRQPQFLSQQFQRWQQEFDYIIIDAPPILNTSTNDIAADHIACSCDATLLVVLSCRTSDRSISEALRTLRNKGVTPIGCILNDQYNPPLKTELIRELNRLPRFLSRWSGRLAKVIANNTFLAMEV